MYSQLPGYRFFWIQPNIYVWLASQINQAEVNTPDFLIILQKFFSCLAYKGTLFRQTILNADFLQMSQAPNKPDYIQWNIGSLSNEKQAGKLMEIRKPF